MKDNLLGAGVDLMSLFSLTGQTGEWQASTNEDRHANEGIQCESTTKRASCMIGLLRYKYCSVVVVLLPLEPTVPGTTVPVVRI